MIMGSGLGGEIFQRHSHNANKVENKAMASLRGGETEAGEEGGEAREPVPGGGKSGVPGATSGLHDIPLSQLRAVNHRFGDTEHLFKFQGLAIQQNKETVEPASYHITFHFEKIKFRLFTKGT